jgi:hypothetical protein
MKLDDFFFYQADCAEGGIILSVEGKRRAVRKPARVSIWWSGTVVRDLDFGMED